MSELDYSVVIPAYNAAPFIRDTLEAILAQRPAPREVVVVDDGSTDDTQAIVTDYPAPVRCIRVENGGQGLARKTGILASGAPWIALCDSDDVWNTDHIARRVGLLQTFPDADFTFSDCYSFGPGSDPEHSLLGEAPNGWLERWARDITGDYFRVTDPYAATLEFNPMYVCGLVFKRDAYIEMGGFLDEYSRWMAEDSEFVRRFLALPGLKVAGDAKQTWGYRRHQQNYSAFQWRNIQARARIIQEHLDRHVVPAHCIGRARQAVIQARADAFDIAYWEGNYGAACDLYRELPAEEKGVRRWLRFAISIARSKLPG